MSGVDTGNGATFTLSVQSLSLAIKSISIGAETLDMLDKSVLATVERMEKVFADLKDGGDVTVVFFWDTELDDIEIGTLETGTVTLPLRSDEDTAANYAGSGGVSSLTRPTFENNTLQEGTLIFSMDGITGPAYTPAVMDT